MALLRNKWKLTAVSEETQEKHPGSGQSWNMFAPWSSEDYITQMSEEIESLITNKLSQEFSRTGSRILGVLSEL